ncbi:MAG: hypothetical protein RL329_708 [Bacteroidota bacterium]
MPIVSCKFKTFLLKNKFAMQRLYARHLRFDSKSKYGEETVQTTNAPNDGAAMKIVVGTLSSRSLVRIQTESHS